MTPERWRRVSAMFHLALARTSVDREAFIADACGGDPALQREVAGLLSAHDQGRGFGDTPVGGPAPPLARGTVLGPYVIESWIGAGGMGEVYKARDPRLDRTVAIKMLSSGIVNDVASREGFVHEARAIAALNHPNICTLHDVGDNYLVMELVAGATLRECLQRPLPLARGLGIARQVLAALAAAHRGGVVHGDLKPDNVMVRADGYVKVLDFGLASWLPTAGRIDASLATAATDRSPILGTIAYMSPEQIEGQAVDQRSDLFAFGITLYEILSGQHPWPRASPSETLLAILGDDPAPLDPGPDGSAELSGVVRTLLRKEPAERYATAEIALRALTAASAGRDGFAASALANPLTSIAVLPFACPTDGEDSRTLSLGFADALVTIFGNLQDIVVSPTAAILAYAADSDPARVCRELGVHYSLQGTVQKLEAGWRVSIRLFEAVTQTTALSEDYEFDLAQVFEIQDDIGGDVVELLKGRFASAALKSRDRYSRNAEAYGAFMAGLRDSSSDRLDTLQHAAGHLTKAVEHDPEFALAHATLSFVSMNIHFQFDPQNTWVQQAEYHCRRALALAPDLPEAHLARSWILWSPARGFQHIEAIDALERVLATRPHLERAHNRMSSICQHIGRLAEARQAHEQALRSNPKTRTGNLEWIYLMSGDYARAEKATEAWCLERPGNLYALMTRVLPPLWSGDLDTAAQRLAVVLTALPDEPLNHSMQAMLHARRGQADLALQCVRRALESPRSFGHTHHVHHYIASAYALLGDTATAMAWLQRSVAGGWACWPFFRIDPFLENLREEREFTRLMAELEQTYSTFEITRL